MTKHISPRRVAKPKTPALNALLTTTSIAAALAGWAIIANHEAPAETMPYQQPTGLPLAVPTSAIILPELPPIASLPTLVPRPDNLADLGTSSQQIQQQPVQVPPADQAVLPQIPSAQVRQAPGQSLRTVNPPPAATRKSVPLATTRSSR